MQDSKFDSPLLSDKSTYVFNTADENLIINGHPDDGVLSRVNSPTTYGFIDDGIKLESGDTIDKKIKREQSTINVEAILIGITFGENRYDFVGYFAIKNIPQRQELFLDYGKDYWEHLYHQNAMNGMKLLN